jgi:GMP synthase (glutamine-hydrolysing)
MDDSRRFLICGVSSPNDAGLVYSALEQAGCTADCTDHYRIFVSFDPQRHVGLIILGAGEGTNAHSDDENIYGCEMKWVEIALKSHTPILGICHGAQLLAYTCHKKKLNRGTRKADIGLTRLILTERGKKDPVLCNVGPEAQVVQWHYDTFEVPHGAIDLARSPTDRRPAGRHRHGHRPHSEAFRIGRNVYGLQFHPDPTAEMLKSDLDWFWRKKVPDERILARVEETSRAVLAAWVKLALDSTSLRAGDSWEPTGSVQGKNGTMTDRETLPPGFVWCR